MRKSSITILRESLRSTSFVIIDELLEDS